MKRYSTLVINETQIKSHNAVSLPIRMVKIEKNQTNDTKRWL